MAEAEQSVGVVSDAPAGQRLAERLVRSGVSVQAVAAQVFAEEARAGQLYLAPLSLFSSAESAARQGAHICLAPPWPVGAVTVGGGAIAAVEVERRGGACVTPALASVSSEGAGRALTILYRERLVGALGAPFVESESGEPLLATLPRASNRHGYIMVTTLQLSMASAQTRLDDVARLIQSLLAWLLRHAEPAIHPSAQERQDDADAQRLAEEYAPIVLLALSLAAPDTLAMIAVERARHDFNQVCRLLGLPSDPARFAGGWAWLEAHGVVSAAEHGSIVMDVDARARYSALWQLDARLRRLRRAGEMMWDGGA